MNPVQVLFHQPWVARLGWTLLHFLWQGTLIAALLGLLRGWTERAAHARFRYIAACAALAAMALAPPLTYALLPGPAATPSSTAMAAAAPALPAGGYSTSLLPPDAWEWVSPRLGAAWLLGVMFCWIRLLGGWLVAARLRTKDVGPAPVEWQARLERLMALAGVFRKPGLRVSSRVGAPVVIGWLRPIILVPVGAVAGLPVAHLEALLAHELAHIRRHDYLVNLLQSFAEAVLFYHPAVWWVSGQIRIEREHCCDDLAVAAGGGDVLAYARALAEVETSRSPRVQALAVNGGSLRNRIARLLEPRRAVSHTLPAGGFVWGLIVALLIAIGAGAACSGAAPVTQAQEAVVDRQTIWPDTVKQGDLAIEVRGLGTLASATAAEVKLAEQQAHEVAVGQPVKIGFQRRQDIVAGRVQGVRPGVNNGVVTADVAVLAPLPTGINPGDAIDAIITIGNMSNVVYVGRPVFGQANSESTLFKFDPDGQHATRVKVQFGRSSVNQIEINSGLEPGDRVILSDMKAYANYDRITLK